MARWAVLAATWWRAARCLTVDRAAPAGWAPLRIAVRNCAVLYTHGAGWVFGNAHTHDRLIRGW